jgi:menaquinone-dependent protoporphyrinogen IX oxidase
MRAVIIYKGKYGATKQYADWLGEELALPVRNANIINYEQLDQYDTLVIGTSVYIGKLRIESWLKRNLAHLRNKRILFFQVAGSPPGEIEKRLSYNAGGIPEEILERCKFYFLPGRLVIDKLFWKDRFMLKMGARSAKKEADKKTMLTDYDHVKKVHLEEIVADIKNFRVAEITSNFSKAKAIKTAV